MPRRQIIITIHGIRNPATARNWQDVFKEFVATQDPTIEVYSFKYGFVIGFASWMTTWAIGLNKILKLSKPMHSSYANQFAEFLQSIIETNIDADVSIVGHSFGTWLIHEALSILPAFRVKNIVLIAGVINAHIEGTNFQDWMARAKVAKVYAWFNRNDVIVRNIATYPFGHLGCFGFVRADHPEDVFEPAVNPYFDVVNMQTDEKGALNAHDGVVSKLEVYGQDLLKHLTA